jgi:hypothetical protein
MPKERQRARSLEEEKVSDPLGKGNDSTRSRQNHAQANSTNHQSKARTTQRAPLAHMQAPPKPKHTPPKPMQQCNMEMEQRAKTCSLYPGWLDRIPWAVRPPLWDLTAWGAVRSPQQTGPAPNFSKTARTTLNTF